MPTIDTSSEEEVVAQQELGFDPESAAEGTRILEFTKGGEKFRVQITADQRFTFGSLSPGSKYASDLALRIYEGANKDNQLAVFVGVQDVRDISVPVAKRIRKVKSEAKHESGAGGSKTESRVERDVDYIPF